MAKQHVIQYVNFYTDGSAARQIEPAAPAKHATLPKQKKQKRKVIYLDPVAILGLAVAACMLVMMLVGLNALNEAQEKTEMMSSYVEVLTQKNEDLNQALLQGYDPDEIRTTALALGMIPSQQAPQITIDVQAPAGEQEEPVSVWTQLAKILSNVFA